MTIAISIPRETPISNCPNCGGPLLGDGIIEVRHCRFANLEDVWDSEPNDDFVYCDEYQTRVNNNDI